jgi:hypothetical protein
VTQGFTLTDALRLALAIAKAKVAQWTQSRSSS